MSRATVDLHIDEDDHVYFGLKVKDIRTERHGMLDCHSGITVFHPTCYNSNRWKVPPMFLRDNTLVDLKARLESYLATTMDVHGRRALQAHRDLTFNGRFGENWTVVCDLWQ